MLNQGVPRPNLSNSAVQPKVSRPVPPQQNPAGAEIADSELHARWAELLSEVRKQRISLGSILESTTPLGVRGGVLHLACTNEFQASSIKRHKEFLAEIVHTLLNVRIRVEAEIRPAGDADTSSPEKDGPPLQQSTEEEHPVIKALRRELGAEPL